MAFINKQDTNGTKSNLAQGELGFDAQGSDASRVYVGDVGGNNNIALAKKSEVDANVTAINSNTTAINNNSTSIATKANKFGDSANNFKVKEPASDFDAVTKKYVDTTVAGSTGIGYGQTWQDVLSARVFNTAYTNNTNKPIQVSIRCRYGDSENGYFLVDSIKVGGFGWTAQPQADTETISIIVPVGGIYKIESNGIPYPEVWAELR